MLIARAAIKSEFRIEQTMIRARGNNPLKFSADDDDALAALLGAGRRTDMAPHEAVADALRDIRLHELATMAAMQAAVRAMLDGLDPAKLRASAEQGGGMTLLPAQKKARAWDAFEALHARTVQALADDFDSVFGKAFARAYERALRRGLGQGATMMRRRSLLQALPVRRRIAGAAAVWRPAATQAAAGADAGDDGQRRSEPGPLRQAVAGRGAHLPAHRHGEVRARPTSSH